MVNVNIDTPILKELDTKKFKDELKKNFKSDPKIHTPVRPSKPRNRRKRRAK